MKQSKVDFKSTVINEEFGFILYYLISKDDIFLADDFIDEYALRIKDMSISKNVKEIFKDCKNNCIFLILEYSDGVYHSYYEFKFFINTHKVYFNCYVKEAYENDDELILLDSYCFSFDDKFFNNLFNLPQIEEKTISEPEQTSAEENKPSFELTPLEHIIFRERDTCIERYSLFLEKAEEAENDDDYDNYRFDASVAIRIADYLEYIIMEVGLTEKWYSWLAERKKQEAVGVK